MIRKSLTSDIDIIVQIWFEASVKAHTFIESSFWEEKIPDMKNIYLPNSETYVFETDREIKGFISLVDNQIAALFVKPVYQGQGIGSNLMKLAIEQKGSLTLNVYKENHKSLLFYQNHGFEIIHETRDEHTGHMEYIMQFKK